MPVFTANIPGLLKVGDRIEIGGKIKENARKMSVNLCAQEGEEPKDVVLHFDVRFHRDNIISLSRKNGIWIGSGNYDTNYNMFVPGTIFRIVFEVKDTDVITIYCQGKFHSNFLPKIPLSMARYLVAWADVERITHCFFHLGGSKTASGEDIPPSFPQSALPTVIAATAVANEQKRCRRPRKKLVSEPQQMETTETSEDMDNVKPRTKADRYFYESLMCQPPETSKLGSPTSLKCRREMVCRSRTDCRRKYQIRNLEMGKNTEFLDSESLYSEELASKNMDSSSFDGLQDIKLKKHRRSKFALAQVVNFMNKNKKN